MDFKGRYEAVRAEINKPVSARVNQAGELVATPWLNQMAMEGRLFTAGTGLEEAVVTGNVALDDTAATFTLTAPLGGVLVIPISCTIARDTEGAFDQTNNALLHLTYSASNLNAIGTLMPSVNLRGDDAPSAAGRLLSTVTLDATTDQDTWVSLAMRLHIIEGWQTTETAVNGGAETEGFGSSVVRPGGTSVFEFNYNFLEKHVPLVLTGGASISFFTSADGTADGFNGHWLWLELPTDTYGVF